MRYSRRRGPTANHEATALWTTIPGMSIARYWDTGPLLICARAVMGNGSGGICNFSIRITIDSIPISGIPPTHHVPDTWNANLSGQWMEPITEGPHTIDLCVIGNAAPGDNIYANSAELIVLQLPLWDDETDFITL